MQLESIGQLAEYHTTLKSPGVFCPWKGWKRIAQVALGALRTDLKGSLVFGVQGLARERED